MRQAEIKIPQQFARALKRVKQKTHSNPQMAS